MCCVCLIVVKKREREPVMVLFLLFLFFDKYIKIILLYNILLVIYKTDMAQRQRAGLITPRSQDRNLLWVRCIVVVYQSNWT